MNLTALLSHISDFQCNLPSQEKPLSFNQALLCFFLHTLQE